MKLRHWFVGGHIVDETGDGEIAKYAKGEIGDKDDKALFSLFLRSISVCHTVVPAKDVKTVRMSTPPPPLLSFHVLTPTITRNLL